MSSCISHVGSCAPRGCTEQMLACRDIKPENFLLTDKSDKARLKLCDFGLSSYWQVHRHELS